MSLWTLGGPGGALLRAAVLAAALATSALAQERYLIVTPTEYAGSAPLTQFANAKTAQGYDVVVYTVPAGTSNTAIRAYIQSLWSATPRPKYALLVGDTDGSSAGTNTIPHFVGGGSKAATTDLPYACMGTGDDWYPDLCVGRFSVRTVSQLQAVVDKTLYVETGSYPDPDYVARVALLATEDPTAQAVQNHEWVISTYLEPAEYTPVRIYAAEGGGSDDITAAVNDGCIFVTYFGHSGSSGWSSPSFGQGQVQALSNAGLYGLVMGWSCNTAHFDYDECFGETWQRVANKGAAAYLSASNYVWWGSESAWESSRRMERYFYQSFFGDDRWIVGPAWQAALWRLLNDPDFGPTHDHTRNIFEMFNLLGDPALHLPQPNGFSLSANPPLHEGCSPPLEEVQYAITVEQQGEFAEPVTLALGGLPAGTTGVFSANDLPPPFASTLTVSGLTPELAGSYVLALSGTATSLTRTLALGLVIAADVPAGPALLEPEDGATDVALKPTLSWEAAPEASSYVLEIATDAEFLNVVYAATSDTTSLTLPSPLETLSQFYWHVRGTNGCGEGPFGTAFQFTTVNMLGPIAYDMLNGETGSYTYFDDTYNGEGEISEPLAPLSGGVGDLTNGEIATQHWDETPLPYVSWKTIDPTITFHFAGIRRVDVITLHLDDSNGSGGVYPPTDVTITDGTTVLTFPVTDPPSGAPFAVSFENLDLVTDTLELHLADYSASRYMMLSEVEFFGGPVVGDTNCDGVINAFDIDAFVLALTDVVQYQVTYPDCHPLSADCNADGTVNAFDIDPFVELLTGN